MTERVNLADMGILSGLADTDYVTIEHDGGMRRYPFGDFKEAIVSDSERAVMYDNVMILFRDTTNAGYRSLAKVADWPSLQSAGQYAIGVVLMLPGNPLVVSVETPPSLKCASGSVSRTGVPLLKDACRDMDGEADTSALIAASSDTVITDTADYAPGYCNRYSRLDSNGLGIGAGHWWLPSLGELLAMRANIGALNYALSLVSGGATLTKDEYWSSTGAAQTTHGWRANFKSGYIGTGNLYNYTLVSRPVTILQED